MFYFDPLYFVIVLPGFLLALWAQAKVRGAYKKYTQIPNSRQLTGLAAAQQLIPALGLNNLNVEGTPGELSDHYDPRSKTLRLSQGVAREPSIASVAIVSHELGHAMQDATGYGPLKLRSAIVPAVQVSPMIAYALFMAGFIFSSPSLTNIGILFFGVTVLFSLITLPVEFDASRRGLKMLESNSLLTVNEMDGAKAVLRAAALTYVAAAVQALLTLLYLLSRSRRR